MARIACINADGLIEYLGDIEMKHRPDVRRATDAEIHSPQKPTKSIPQAGQVAAQKAPTVTIPDMLHAIKQSKTVEEIDALVEKFNHQQDVVKVASRMKEELAGKVDNTTKATKETPDDFTQIKGLGPAVVKALHGADITTFKGLAQAIPEDLRGIMPKTISDARIAEFQEAATQLSA